MVDVLEKRLGDVLRELEAQRDQLRRDLDNVNAQLELIARLVKNKGAVGGKSSPPTAAPGESKSTGSKQGTKKRGRGRPPKNASAIAPAKTEKPAKGAKKRKRGRPPKAASAAKVANSGKVANGKSSERTLKDELLAIAKTNGGMFRIRDASQALVKSGRYEDAVRAAANIQAAIQYYTGNFVKEGSERGLYRAKA